ncbi:GPI ethanolamine phosphate transferase 2 [Bienertia sinuspersici]
MGRKKKATVNSDAVSGSKMKEQIVTGANSSSNRILECWIVSVNDDLVDVVPVESTPATKHQQASSDDDGGWKVVTKKSKDKAWRGSISGNPFKIIWEKLKLVKKALKQVHSQEFTSITSKIDKARDELTSVQQSLAQEPDLLELQEKEKICTLNLKKWLSIEESALRQKARIQWLKLGDSTEKFSTLLVLYSEQGQKLDDMKDIRGEFVKFYSSLLGSRSTELESIDLPTVRNGPQVSVQHMAYKKLMGMHTKVYWRRIVCNNKASPRSLFIVWLMLSKKLVTVEVLRKWQVQCDMLCVFCQRFEESIDHLFFGCQFTQAVWQRVLNKLGCMRNVTDHNKEVDCAARISRRKSDKAKVYCMLFAEYIYAVWLQRNDRRFGRNHLDENMLFKQILFRVAIRCSDVQRLLLL